MKDMQVMAIVAQSRANLISWCNERGAPSCAKYMRALVFEVGKLMAEIRSREEAIAMLDDAITHLLDGTPLPNVFEMARSEERPTLKSSWTPSHVSALLTGVSIGMAIGVVLIKWLG